MTFLAKENAKRQFIENAVGAAGATATIVVAGVAGKRHYLTDISASYTGGTLSSSVTGMVTIKFGTETKYTFVVVNGHTDDFREPLRAPIGADVTLELDGAGTSDAHATLIGFTGYY
jgi:hypothetical protein